MTTASLRFAPDILRRLGEELVPHPDLGVMELVRNAYDADAMSCTIELEGVDQAGGTVVVSDSGDGMTVEDILGGWLLLGRSSKAESTHSPKGRRKVGEKGLGRLAALRLGREVTMSTRPRDEPGQEHVLSIDWGAFESAEAVEDVPLSIMTRTTVEPPGTRIEISQVKDPFSDADVDRLARAVILLTGPFPGPEDFDVRLNAPQFEELARLVQNKYFDEYEYLVKAEIDGEGQACAVLQDWRGEVVARADHARISSSKNDGRGQASLQYFAPEASLEIWTFNLSADNFSIRNSKRKVKDVQKWLGAVGGVHLYHRGLRVHPYGDEGHDWLDMNLRRVRSPEVRPGTNTAVGRVSLNDDGNRLVPKTDRMGFLENAAFESLAEFGRNVLDWAAQERRSIRDKAREEQKNKSKSRTKNAWAKIEDSIRSLPARQREAIREATNELRDAYDEKINTVEQDLLLYRTLSTVGTTSAVFAHETKHPVDIISSVAGSLDRRARRILGDDAYTAELQEPVESIKSAAAALKTYAEIPLKLLQRKKRSVAVVDVNQVLLDIVDLFRPHLSHTGIDIQLQLCSTGAPVRTMVASIEAIFANLVTNSVYAFTQPYAGAAVGRILLARTEVTEDLVILSVIDNGPGIDLKKLELEEIWLPGMSTREDGTGLGLTIVRDAAREINGKVRAKAVGELGGAEFIIELPRAIS